MGKSYFLGVGLILSNLLFAQNNLVQNGGFENELENWRGEVASLSPFDKKAGNASCIITQFVGAEWKGIDQVIAIPKNTVAIEFSAWIKSDAIEKGKNEWNTGKFDVEFTNASGKNIKNESVAAVTGSLPWTYYKKVIVIPESASKVRLLLALGQTNGTILFDEVKAVAINQQALNAIQEADNANRMPKVISDGTASKLVELTNGNFENGIASWRGSANVSKTCFKEGEAALVLNSSTFDWTGIDQIADVPEGKTTITISGWLKSDNIKQGKDSWNNGLLNVAFTAADGSKTGDDQSVAFVTGSTDWTLYTKTFPLPSGTKKYRLMVALGFAPGTLYADALTVTFK